MIKLFVYEFAQNLGNCVILIWFLCMSIVNNVILLSVMCTACNANGELGQTRLNYVTRARSALTRDAGPKPHIAGFSRLRREKPARALHRRARSARLVVVNLAYLSDLTFEYSDLRVVVYYYS